MQRFRYIGMKLTPQRLAILDFLDGNTSHPSAEDVFQFVSKRFPTMSLATVYSTLAVLKKKGEVLELTIDPDKKRYDPETSEHHHLICLSCKRIVDMPSERRIELPERVIQNFTIVKSHIEAYGYCPACKKTITV